MILAIDGYEANVPNRVGIGRFAYETLVRIADLVARGETLFSEIRVYLPDQPIADMPKESATLKYHVAYPKKFWTFIGLPLSLARDRPIADVVFSPTHYIPRFIQTPRVMAIMDVSYLSYPELFRSSDLHKLVHWTAYSAAHARAIITISQSSKHAIIQAYKVDGDHIHVVYPGLAQASATANHMTEEGIQKYALPDRYILSVGTLQPRKNFTKLICAFSKLSDKNVGLVIVGKKGWMYQEILSAPVLYGVEDRVKFLDFVPDEDLPQLYTNAEFFVLPSLYEGFGLPVLEAMSYHKTVVISDISSLPEIAQKAAIYVNPEKTESIVEGLSQALKEKGTAIEKKRVALGDTRVKLFTWDNAAKEVLSVLTRVGQGIRS